MNGCENAKLYLPNNGDDQIGRIEIGNERHDGHVQQIEKLHKDWIIEITQVITYRGSVYSVNPAF